MRFENFLVVAVAGLVAAFFIVLTLLGVAVIKAVLK